ncbi:MAG: heavy metal sensor histidine kinase [Bryobacterales bacterium]|nr:heavy metal sensor histidine kinase [Bryobacterales bacterium]
MSFQPSPLRLIRGLRFRLTLSYAIFFTLAAAGLGAVFRHTLENILEARTREALVQEWAALKGYLHIDQRRINRSGPIWFYDREDPDESFIVARLQRIYLLADAEGRVIERSSMYRSIGIDSPEQIREVIRGEMPVWRIRDDPDGTPFLIRAGVIFDDKRTAPYYVAIGRSLAPNRDVVAHFTRNYVFLAPLVIAAGCLLGWFLAGRALRPVKDVAGAAQRISGSNLSLRIPARGAGDELDYLITTFNRMIERLETSFQQVRQFSADVSHELRTPITAIRGQLEVALFTARSEEQYREAIENAMQDVERLSQIVRALLLLSQAESGQLALQLSEQDLAELVREVVDQFQIPAEEAGVSLLAELPAACPARVDRIQIERLVSNLLSNAVKFTAPGGQVRVTLAPAGAWLRLAVEDTGCGIEAEHLPHIFDRLYRAPSASPDAAKGFGLGLSFVAWIVKAHGGTIEVDSVPGKGSRFQVTLPVAADDRPVERLVPARAGAARSASQ